MAYVDDHKDKILSIIDSWAGKLTWELLASYLYQELNLKKKPSRHTLLLHDEIKHAFDLKKKSLREKKADLVQKAKLVFVAPDDLSSLLSGLNSDDATIEALIKRAKKLEAENEKLNDKCRRLESQLSIIMDQFVRWQSNLSRMDGLDMNKLLLGIDESLPEKNIR